MEASEGTVVIADRPDDATETATQLEDALPVSCENVESPSSALTAVADGGVDCVVTELAFGDGAGADASLLADLREMSPSLPVVVYTNEDGESGEPQRLVGATAYVEKTAPDATQQLTQWVERSVASRGEWTDRRDRISSIAHDLKSPLQAANVYLDAVSNDCDSEYIENLTATHGRLFDLVADLSSLAGAGRAVTDPVPLSLESIAEDAWTIVDTANATLDVDTDVTVQGDPQRLSRLLENLFVNAVQHGGQNVTVTVGVLDGDSNATQDGDAQSAGAVDQPVVGFFVADDGPGIPEDERDAVFERGYTTTERGTGWGLAIVAELAEAHGWTVTAAESEGGGARFEIEPPEN